VYFPKENCHNTKYTYSRSRAIPTSYFRTGDKVYKMDKIETWKKFSFWVLTGIHKASCPVGTGGSFPWSRVAGAWAGYSPPSCSEIRDA